MIHLPWHSAKGVKLYHKARFTGKLPALFRLKCCVGNAKNALATTALRQVGWNMYNPRNKEQGAYNAHEC
jgi:hypothetical protein